MTLWNCTSCSKSFTRKGDLTRHQLLHTGIKPHVCPTCGKGFAQFSGLKTHLNVHTKAKPYVCGIGTCKKAFGDPSSCSRHRKETHRREGAYKCPLHECGTRIKRRSAFVKHLRRHGIDTRQIDINTIASNSASIPDDQPCLFALPPCIPSEVCHIQGRESSVSSSSTDSPLFSSSSLLDPSYNIGSEFFLDSNGYLNTTSSSIRHPPLDQDRLSTPLAAMYPHEVFGHGNDANAGFSWTDFPLFSCPFSIPTLDTSSDNDSTFTCSQTSSPLTSYSSLDVPNFLDHSELSSGHTSQDFFRTQ